jgi:hypothetical protein
MSPWEDCRKRRLLFLAAVLGFLPAAVGVALPVRLLSESSGLAAAVMMLWMACFGVASIRLNCFPCPRCRKPFFHTTFVQNPLVRRCLHCGLPKWATWSEAASGKHRVA